MLLKVLKTRQLWHPSTRLRGILRRPCDLPADDGPAPVEREAASIRAVASNDDHRAYGLRKVLGPRPQHSSRVSRAHCHCCHRRDWTPSTYSLPYLELCPVADTQTEQDSLGAETGQVRVILIAWANLTLHERLATSGAPQGHFPAMNMQYTKQGQPRPCTKGSIWR